MMTFILFYRCHCKEHQTHIYIDTRTNNFLPRQTNAYIFFYIKVIFFQNKQRNETNKQTKNLNKFLLKIRLCLLI